MALTTSSFLQTLALLQGFTTLVQGLPTQNDPKSRSLWSRAASWTNPLFDGWYADPEGVKFEGDYWVYVTLSGAEGTYFDAFSSPDLATWTKHSSIYTADGAPWAVRALWAPCTVERDGKYYLYYTANEPSTNTSTSGIGVAVSDSPGGPFTDILDQPLVEGRDADNIAAMDQQVFLDDDGKQYLLWGNPDALIAPLNDDMKSLSKWDDGSESKNITPDRYTEGSFMLKHNGKYYFTWSEDFYWNATYSVAYGMSDSLTGPFERIGTILSQDGKLAEGPGHHSILKDDDGKYYMFYHRRAYGDNRDERVIAVDRMYFNEDGTIKPVVMT